MGASSGLEGAELPGEGGAVSDGVSFDSAAFLRSLGDALGLPGDTYLGSEEEGGSSGDEGSSFFGGGSDEDSEEEEEPDLDTVYHAQRAERAQQQQAAAGFGKKDVPGAVSTSAAAAPKGLQPGAAAAAARERGKGAAAAPEEDEQWEARTATDSDDDEASNDADFTAAYEQSLQRELAASRMGASFAKSGAAGSEQEGPAHGAAAAGGRAAGEAEMEDEEEELAPVDVDLNLVRSLLASYAGAPCRRLLLLSVPCMHAPARVPGALTRPSLNQALGPDMGISGVGVHAPDAACISRMYCTHVSCQALE